MNSNSKNKSLHLNVTVSLNVVICKLTAFVLIETVTFNTTTTRVLAQKSNDNENKIDNCTLKYIIKQLLESKVETVTVTTLNGNVGIRNLSHEHKDNSIVDRMCAVDE